MILPFTSSLRFLVLLAAALFGLHSPLRAAPDVSAGWYHSLLLKADGTVWACGDNSYGQLGDGTFLDRIIPVRVMSDVQAISAGGLHSLFLKTDGTVWACGYRFGERIGDGPRTDRGTPVQLLTGVQAISADTALSFFRKIDGTVWGKNNYGWDINGDDSIRKLEDVRNFSSLGVQYSGYYSTGEQYLKYIAPLDNNDVEDVVYSGNTWPNLIVLKTNGTVYSVNIDSGIRTTLALSGVKAISQGYGERGGVVSRNDVLYLMDDGKVWSGGYDGSTPELLGIDGVQAISGGESHALLLKFDGTVWGLGRNNYNGELGVGVSFYNPTVRPLRFGKVIAGVPTRQRGQVWVLRDGQKFLSGLNGEFYEGDVVITGPKSFLEIDCPDGSQINVGPGSELKLEKFRPKEPSIIELLKGRVRSYIQNNGTGAIKLWMTVKNAVIGVRGTEFDVTYSEENGVGTTRLDVLSGLVDMTDLSTQQTVGVGAGESRSTVAVAVPRPVMTVQPANGAVVNGQTLSASIVAEGALSYQWLKDGENIAGATARTYTLATAQLADTGAYTCAVTYADNPVRPYLSNPIWVSVYPETQLAIRAQPLKQTGLVGEAAFFSIIATSTEPVAYQWNKDGVPISGATAATYSLANIQIADTGVYTCSVRDADEQVLSGTAMLTVYAGGISGIVTSAQTGQPLTGIEVELYRQDVGAGTDWDFVDSTFTGAGGAYQFSDLVQGTYRIGFRDVQGNHINEYHNNSPDLDAATDILVPVEKAVTGIDASLAKASRMAGKVTGPDGTTPLTGINVAAYRWANADGGYWDYVSDGDTDLNGNYNIGGLPTGTYRVEFTDWEGEYFGESYADAVDLDSAIDIIVPAEQTVTGINASLAKASRIAGKVTGPDGTTPLAGIYVTAHRWTNTDGGNWDRVAVEETDLSGNYSIGGLPTGTYRVEFIDDRDEYIDESYADAVDLDSAIDIIVPAEQAVTGIDASLASVAPPEPAVIVKFQMTSAGQYEIHYTGKIGQTYIIQKRSLLGAWTDERQHTCQSGVNIVPVASSASSMFWRLKTAP